MAESISGQDQACRHDGASKSGESRSKSLSKDRRQEIARKAANTRWHGLQEDANSPPKAAYPGTLVLGDLSLPCAVLTDQRRVVSERGIIAALGGKRGGSHWKRLSKSEDYLPVFISAANLAPFTPPSLKMALSQPILYRLTGRTAYGVEAVLLPEICEVWLKARRADALTPQQDHIAATAEMLMSGLARVGIVALVDEATGYQEIRDRLALHKILEAYITELAPWSKRFPDEYYEELFRLRGWPYSPPQPKRPMMVGKLTNELVYDKLPPGVVDELRIKNPVVKNGRRGYKHHQYLTEDIGHVHLEKQLLAVTTLMRAAPSWAVFEKLFDRAFSPNNRQLPMPLAGDIEVQDEY